MTYAIGVASELDIAEVLTLGPQPVEAIASAVGAQPQPLYRLLRLLAAHDIFQEREDGSFEQTEQSQLLRSDSPESLRGWARWHGSAIISTAWQSLGHSVRTGESGFEHAHGRPIYELLRDDAASRALFDGAMRSVASAATPEILELISEAKAELLVDVGGGDGSLLSEALRTFPDLRGVLFELPEVAELGATRLRADGVYDRCEVVSGDFFEGVPVGGDLYVLRTILHNWPDDEAVRILARSREAVKAGGRVVVAENVVPAGNDPSRAKSLDLTMLVEQRGRERTEHEFRDLFQSAGLRLVSVIKTETPFTVLVGQDVIAG